MSSCRATNANGRPETGWYYYPTPAKDDAMKVIPDTDKSPRAATYDEILARARSAGYEINNAGWRQKLLSWNWTNVSLDGYPGWAIEGRTPPWCHIRHVNGDTWEGAKRVSDEPATKSSGDVQNAWDSIAEVQFYSRDVSYDGSCSVGNGEAYGSLWWFRTVAERDRFLSWLAVFDPTIQVKYRCAAEIPKGGRMKMPGPGAMDLHAFAIDTTARGETRVTGWRYGYRATVTLSVTAMEDVLEPWKLVLDALWEAADCLWGLSIVDHDPGDEDRFA